MSPARPRRRLATRLLRRLIWISAAVLVANIGFVAAYDAADHQALLSDVVNHEVKNLEAAILAADTPQLDIANDVAAHFADHPEAYGYLVLDSEGRVVTSMNAELIAVALMQIPIFAEDWAVRKTGQLSVETYASHIVERPEGSYRLYFAILADPANLIGAAIRDEFFGHVWLPMVPTAVFLIGGALLILRREIGPISDAAAWAREITSNGTTPPFERADMPAEIEDLTQAVNNAVARLNAALESEKRRAAEAAHALRTPVAVLVARLDALPEGPEYDRMREDIKTLSRTVTQFLLSAGADRLTISEGENVKLCDVVEATVSKLTPWVLLNGSEIIFSTDGRPQRVFGSAEGIELALTNLIENAVHHGKAPIKVRVGPGPSITVSDAGAGLAVDAGPKIFEPFWRGEGAPKGGAGLGLAIVDRIQRAHNGRVETTSTSQGGAMFKLFYIPTD